MRENKDQEKSKYGHFLHRLLFSESLLTMKFQNILQFNASALGIIYLRKQNVSKK